MLAGCGNRVGGFGGLFREGEWERGKRKTLAKGARVYHTGHYGSFQSQGSF
jgi:hypothetical protein